MDRKQLQDEIFSATEKILNYIEVAIPSHEQYKKLRSKTLRIMNDLCRKVDAQMRNGNGKGE